MLTSPFYSDDKKSIQDVSMLLRSLADIYAILLTLNYLSLTT
jgi:hypothetical protein